MRLRQRYPKHTHTFKIRSGITRIESVQDARGCHCLVKCENDTAAMVDVVEVIGQGGKPSAFKIVQCILKYYTTNITALKLRLSFEPTSHMLQNLEFSDLRIFETNIPHAIIAPFLGRHPQITNLVLDVCNPATATTAVACPLTNCNLSHIEQLSCPKGCVWPLVSSAMPASPLYNLQVIQRASQDSLFPLRDLFNFRHIPTTSNLYYLHIDFDHTTRNLLQAISRAAPQLDTLRLVESKFADKDNIALWDDAYTWEGSLLSYRHLRRLLVQTSRSITTHSSESDSEDGPNEVLQPEDELELKLAHQRQQEDDVVRRWLVFPPSSLTEFQIWTKAFTGRANGERMAIWMLKNKCWGCSQWEVVRNHPIKGEEVCGGDFV